MIPSGGVLSVAQTTSGAADISAADTIEELNGLFNKTTGTAGASNRFGDRDTGGATILLTTNLDGTRQLVMDRDGNGSFTQYDIMIVLDNPTVTSFNANVFVSAF